MNCEQFQERIDDYLSKDLSEARHTEAEHHLQQCDTCRELVGMLQHDTLFDEVPLPERFVDAVLQQTSGSTCESAERRMVAHLDGALGELDQSLVSLHLSECPECRRLKSTLERLSDELPQLAEIAPPHGFAQTVLSLTSERPTFEQRLTGWWQRLLSRPRFAFEAAYLGILVVVLAVGPGSMGILGEKLSAWTQVKPDLSPVPIGELVEGTTSKTSMWASQLTGRATVAAKSRLRSSREFVEVNKNDWVDRAERIPSWIGDQWNALTNRLSRASDGRGQDPAVDRPADISRASDGRGQDPAVDPPADVSGDEQHKEIQP